MSLIITGLEKAFGTKKVLQNFHLTVDGPLVLMGPSGCGKTTLLRILMGLDTADAGTVILSGHATGRIGAVFQEDRLCPQLTAADNICLPGADREKATQELQKLGFTPVELRQPTAKLSGGQKRRAALLRALLCPDADTLLLDEPFTGMDADLIGEAAATIRRLAAGKDTLLVTHDAAAVAALGWPVVQLTPAE